MVRSQNPNLEILLLAVEQLGELVDEMVFLGGCATGLLMTDPAASPIRVTKDVDAIVQVVSHADYYKFSDKLRSQGFKEDVSEGAPICRWIAENVILDVMPTDRRILGFGNKWYIPAMENAVVFQLSDTRQIRLVSAPYFLITKLEAFDDGRAVSVLQAVMKQPYAELSKEVEEKYYRLKPSKFFEIDGLSYYSCSS